MSSPQHIPPSLGHPIGDDSRTQPRDGVHNVVSDSAALATGVRKRATSQAQPEVSAQQLLTASTDPRALLPLPVVCILISMCRASVYKMVTKGTFPAPIKVGHASRWKAAQVHEWMQAHGGGDAPLVNIVTGSGEPTTANQVAMLAERVDALAAQADRLTKLVDRLHRRLSRVGQALTADR